MTAIAPYVAAMCRPATDSVFDENAKVLPEKLDANIEEFCRCIRKAARDHGARLVVFPEFALTGYAMMDNDGWIAASVSFPGAEIDRIAEVARETNTYVLVQAAEKHEAFPGRYFLSAGILTPEGTVGLVHRKNYTLSLRTSPVDIRTLFAETLGEDAFFPVLDTPIGVLGVSIAAEVHWPEAIRALTLKGAEVILNPIANAEGVDYLQRPGAELARAVRAFENVAYLGMTNIAAGAAPAAVYDYNGGQIGAEADAGLFTLATIDIEALRKARAAGGANLLAQIQPSLHEDIRALPLWPDDALHYHPATNFDQLMDIEKQAWARMCAMGRGTMPSDSE